MLQPRFRNKGLAPLQHYWGRLIFVCLCSSLFLTACDGDTATPTTESAIRRSLPTLPLSSPNDWQSRWLNGIPCSPPCWEGIIPGQTSAQEAVEILKKNPKFSNPQIRFHSAVTWSNDRVNHLNLAEAYFDLKDPKQVIYEIHPGSTLFGVEFRLKDVIQAYGEPTYIIGLKGGPPAVNRIIYQAEFIYIKRGMGLGSTFYDKNEFNQNLVLKPPVLFVPSEEGFRRLYSGLAQYAVKWEGMKAFSFYCKIEELYPCSDN